MRFDDASDLFQAMFDAVKPPPDLKPSEVASMLRLPRVANSRAGKLTLTPLQAKVADLVTPEVRQLTLASAAQVGKTTLGLVLLAHAMLKGGPLAAVRPTTSDAENWFKEHLRPLLLNSPALKEQITDINAQGISGPNFSLAFCSAYRAEDLSGRAIRVALGDEVSRWPSLTSNGEGNPVSLLRRRLHTWRDSLLILTSSPLFPEGVIWQEFLAGSQHRHFIKCPDCGEEDILTLDRVVFESGRPQDALLKCKICGALHDEERRLHMIAHGDLRPTNPDAPPDHISVQLAELDSEFSSIAKVAALIDGAKNLEAQRTLQCLCAGLPWEARKAVALEVGDIMSRSIEIKEPLPKEIESITAAADVQQSKIVVQWVGHSSDGAQHWILDSKDLWGDTTGPAPFQMLDESFDRAFTLANGERRAAQVRFVDGGYLIESVLRAVLRQRGKGHNCHITLGRANWELPDLKKSARLRGKITGLILGVSNLKMRTAAGLRNGAIFTPKHLPPEWFEELTAETLEVRHTRKGTLHEWVKTPGRANEAFDLIGYNLAAWRLVQSPKAQTPRENTKQTAADIASRLAVLNRR